jgi:uncharacterized protein (TIGR02569 family)
VSDGAPDDAVLADFGLAGLRPLSLPGGEARSWRVGDVVLKPVGSIAAARYVAELLASLPESDAVRVPRPVRTVSGGWVSRGWGACRWLPGQPATDRWPDVVAAGTALHVLLRDAPRPAFLDDRDDVWAIGDRVAWGEQPLDIEHRVLRGTAMELAAQLRPCVEAAQLVHGDLTGNVLLAEGLPPAVIDMSCYWRPPSWALAVVAADALAWHGAGPEVLTLVPGPAPVAAVARAALYRLVTTDRHASTLAESDRRPYLARNASAYQRVIGLLHTVPASALRQQ